MFDLLGSLVLHYKCASPLLGAASIASIPESELLNRDNPEAKALSNFMAMKEILAKRDQADGSNKEKELLEVRERESVIQCFAFFWSFFEVSLGVRLMILRWRVLDRP